MFFDWFDWLESGTLDLVASRGLTDLQLSAALGEQIKSPNRLLASPDNYAAVAVGFPECVRSVIRLSVTYNRSLVHRF
jgi:hypothetical protein